jgi:hypothetical protein
MDKPPLWTFEGFVTAAGNRVVEDWYWDEIGQDDRDSIEDILNYLVTYKKSLWVEPRFKNLGDIGEIRKRTDHGALRVYGEFDESRSTFIFLHGELKKNTSDRQGIEKARSRSKMLRQGKGTTHGFDFQKRTADEVTEGSGDES